MAVLGGFILIIILAFLVWLGLMSKFEVFGKRISGKFDKTFNAKKEVEKND